MESVQKPKHPGVFHVSETYRNKTRWFIILGITFLIYFYSWLFNSSTIGQPILFILISMSLLYKGLSYLHEWYYYWSPSITKHPKEKRNFSVDIFTTYCAGEPKEMVKTTLVAMKNISYPHKNYLCDESGDEELRKFCEENDIQYITRTEKRDAKAGNINNALQQSCGEICLVLDPDHIPEKHFLDRTIHYFNDERVGFVQSVQSYYNQKESWVAKAAAEQSYHFYGPLMMGMNSFNTVQVIGANCLFRRKALETIGGHAAGLAEDMHTGMLLYTKKWRGIYVPEVLSRGLVPHNIKAYCGQQLKWSKGVFDLLLYVYPKIFTQLNLRQKIHFLFSGLYFTSGWITLLDFIIPIASLLQDENGINSTTHEIIKHTIPIFFLSIIIRIRSQKYLIEKQEKGYQILGGILQTATWYIHVQGLIYSIFKKKLTYLPTLKSKEKQKSRKYIIPNLLVILTSTIAIVYGYNKEINSYDGWMISFATGNIFILIGSLMMLNQNQRSKEKKQNKFILLLKNAAKNLFEFQYNQFKNGLVGIILILLLYFNPLKSLFEIPKEDYPIEKKYLFFGSEKPMKSMENKPDFIKTKWIWGEPNKFDKEIETKSCQLNFIELEFNKNCNEDTKKEIYKAIYLGYQKEAISELINRVKKNATCTFISYFPITDSITLKEKYYNKAMQIIHDEFQKRGISNIVWVWEYRNKLSEVFYPGKDYVDWIYFKGLKEKNINPIKEYQKIREWILLKKKNTIIDFRPEENQNLTAEQINDSLTAYTNQFKEIKCFIGDTKLLQSINNINRLQWTNSNSLNKKSEEKRFYGIKKKGNKFDFIVNGKAFYIKGIAYNPGHDWRDGNYLLNRTTIKKDLEEIKKTGANCIRIYKLESEQEMLLDEAYQQKLNVIAGFWFDPQIDYNQDIRKKNRYMEETLEKIKKYKNHPSIACWSLGNETWGLLKKHYAKPYLFQVRAAYIDMIERLAQEIHKIDPIHPIMTCIEHDESQIAGELQNLKDYAPSLDVIGINSYYQNQIANLDSIFTSIDSTRPYFVSEFGPSGYWNDHYNKYSMNTIKEEDEKEKMNWYMSQWEEYIVAHQGKNIGGVAYCWRDRMEGSLTWFGITDINRRKKPVYFGLKKIWANEVEKNIKFSKIEIEQKKDREGYYEAISCTIPCNEAGTVYEWKLYPADFSEEIINKKSSINRIQFKAPKKSGNYYLYVYINYGEDKVSTASCGLRIK